jgi:hypothetical protein
VDVVDADVDVEPLAAELPHDVNRPSAMIKMTTRTAA